jgi:hypothetical protein
MVLLIVEMSLEITVRDNSEWFAIEHCVWSCATDFDAINSKASDKIMSFIVQRFIC